MLRQDPRALGPAPVCPAEHVVALMPEAGSPQHARVLQYRELLDALPMDAYTHGCILHPELTTDSMIPKYATAEIRSECPGWLPFVPLFAHLFPFNGSPLSFCSSVSYSPSSYLSSASSPPASLSPLLPLSLFNLSACHSESLLIQRPLYLSSSLPLPFPLSPSLPSAAFLSTSLALRPIQAVSNSMCLSSSLAASLISLSCPHTALLPFHTEATGLSVPQEACLVHKELGICPPSPTGPGPRGVRDVVGNPRH